MRVAHGVVFCLLLACGSLVPIFRGWPWLWLAPFLAYFLLGACIPRLRRSLDWLQVGRLSGAAFAATVVLAAVTIAVLGAYQAIAQPDLHGYHAILPIEALGSVVMAGVVFTVLNATLEEFVFRGVLFEALKARWGPWLALAATTLLFGAGHLRGDPPGPVGAALAALFGLALGMLRLRTGGLALPIAAHMIADATIYCILVHARAI